MTQAVFKQDAGTIPYTPSADVDTGDVVVIGNIVTVAKTEILTSALGAVATDGVFDFEREQATAFTAGDAVYWDADGTPEGGTATGAAVDTSSSGANEFIGFAIEDAADSATSLTVKVAMKSGFARDTIAVGDLSDCGDGAPTAGDLLIGDGDSWEAEPVSGLVTLAATGAVSAATIADASVGLPLVIQKSFTDAATGDVEIFNAACPYKMRVIDAWIENRATNGANANTIQLCASAAGADPITDAMSLNAVADTGVVRATVIDDAASGIAANGSLYLRQTKAGGTMGGVVYILAIPVA